MEEWQRKHITNNLSELIFLTKFNCAVKAELEAKNVLSQLDIDELDAVLSQSGHYEVSRRYYKLLMGRTDAYKVLTRALMQFSQSGAAKLLIRVPPELFNKPLTYLGISTELTDFQGANIEVNGKVFKIHEFFPSADIPKIQPIFENCLSELEIYDTFITKQNTFVLGKTTIPPKPPYYVPRFLSNRIKLNKNIFNADCPDIFVFKKTIARYKLSEIAKPHFTDTSTSQLTKITCRFIYLDENDDWAELKELATVPIHLIKYEAYVEKSSTNESDTDDPSDSESDTDYISDSESETDHISDIESNEENSTSSEDDQEGNFILEDTSAASDILRKFGLKNKRAYLSEDEFLQQQLYTDYKASSVCICDSPGMGKTWLMGNIARVMVESCTGKIIVFVPLENFSDVVPENSSRNDLSIRNVLKYTSAQNEDLLLELIQANLLQMEIFFDGFDEVSSDKRELVRQVFLSIKTEFSNVRMYITSRPHMRRILEQSLGVVAYDILPFKWQNQIDLVVQFWKNRRPESDQISLQRYAVSCLEAFNKSLTQNDKEIAGIPLLCQLIAEVYVDKRAFRTLKTETLSSVPLNLFGMYRNFIKKKIDFVTKDTEEFESIKLVHVWHALKLLFPKNGYHKTTLFQKIKHLLISPKIVRAGILQKHSNGALEFIHRTFAEYFVAEYFITKLRVEIQTVEKSHFNSTSILKILLQHHENKWGDYSFLHSVIVNFFNFLLSEVNNSEGLKIQFSNLIFSVLKDEFIWILCSCCEHNLLHIFNLLTGGLSKCEKSGLIECFTDENCYEFLRVCIKKSTSQIFRSCIHLLTEVLELDVVQINTFDEHRTLIRRAVKAANFEAVEYFVDRVSLQNQSLLKACVKSKSSIEKRENILQLLHNKDPTLIHETQDILCTSWLVVRLFKILVEFGANLSALDECRLNCAMSAAFYMSPSDYHELVQFLLNDCKAHYLFLENEKWKDPLPKITKVVKLLPETMELLLNIPGMDISMKNRWEESLLFHAVEADDVNGFEQLVKRGVDYNARDVKNVSLLHVAADKGRVEMVRYLLSLKLDPNSQDIKEWTPLHIAAGNERLDIVEVLVQNGANVQAKDKMGKTALHLAAEYGYGECTEAVEYLIEKGAQVNDRDEDGNTPLHLCDRTKEVKECLIEMGADIHAKNNEGKTPAQENPHMWNRSNE